MISDIFKKKSEFITNYFETLFKLKKRFPQSIIFEGSNTLEGYFFTLEIARILNCERKKEPACNCTNCRWIRENNHPSIITVTPIDFKEDDSKTVISVKQIEKITALISESSDYHRFFIFSGAKNEPLNEIQQEKISDFKKAGYFLNKEDWYPCSLTTKILANEASNALLKSTEEAPDKTTFVFLADSKENIISTIVSRSLTFKLPFDNKKTFIDTTEFFKNYPDCPIEEALETGYKLLEKQSGENLDIINILDSCQEYLKELLKNNINLSSIIINDIKKFQIAKKQIISLVSPKNAIESLFISLSKEGRNL